MKYGSFLITILLLLNSVTAEASTIQDLNILKDAVKNYAISKTAVDTNSKRRSEVQVGNIDPRLRLVACSTELIVFKPPGSRLQGNSTLGVRCDSPKPWSIYVPVKIAIYEQAIVATQKMNRGQFISSTDIILKDVDISRVRGRSFINIDDLVGTKLKTSIKANQVIDSTAICLICKGDKVLITINSSSVAVTMTGIALNDGSRGDKIRVQNNASRRIIDAIVSEIGIVKVVL